MDGTGGDENEPTDSGTASCLDQFQRTDHIFLNKVDQVSLSAAKSCACPVNRRVDHTLPCVLYRHGK